VLCPPHLCDQWQRELERKFHIRAVIVRTNTIARLERDLPRRDISVYQHYRHMVVSIDFAKSDRRRDQFLAFCPELVIVDEAHASARPGGAAARNQQQRHELVRAVAAKSDRHILLLTATPHSGIEESFRSLLGLLKPEFENLPLDGLIATQRAHLARHFIQRLRADVRKWLGADTFFPERDPKEEQYDLGPEYQALFNDLLRFTQETVVVPGLSRPRQRVRYWAALSLLRCVMSSPAAAVAALRRAAGSAASVESEEEADEEVRQWQVLDPIREEGTNDAVPDSVVAAGERDVSESERRRLREFARRAEAMLDGDADLKIAKAAQIAADLLSKGFRPIIYCRFIETAKYVAERLQQRLAGRFPGLHTLAVTSETGSDEEREARVAELAESPRRVLVATDCLSEGVNLQDQFDAVIHYDLPWNPNRLEQREGRVDRFGQTTPVVPAYLLYGKNNLIDLTVLDVLIRKAKDIYRATGVRVPVPVESESVMQAVAQALFERRATRTTQLQLDLEGAPTVQALHEQWNRAAAFEKENRSRFAQHAIKPEEVARELEATDAVLGDPAAVRKFLVEATHRLDIPLRQRNGCIVLELAGPLEGLKDRLGWRKPRPIVFGSPLPRGIEDAEVIDRNHPLIIALSDRILGEAFSPKQDPQARKFARCGAAYATTVSTRTALLLLRIRYRMERGRGQDLFGEEVVAAGFRPTGDGLEWLDANGQEVSTLLQASATASISQQERVRQVDWALGTLEQSAKRLRELASARAKEIEAAHERLRQQAGGRKIKVFPYAPDILGVYVLVPGGSR
jgi:superfamily II DNA or RNA helicase